MPRNSVNRKRSRSPEEQVDNAEIGRMLKSVLRKLGRVEQQQKRYRRHRSPLYSEYGASESEMEYVDQSEDEMELDCFTHTESPIQLQTKGQTAQDKDIATEVIDEPAKAFDIGSILGEVSTKEKLFSEPVLTDLVPRYVKILLCGLADEIKADLLKKYLPPENFKEIVPPKINPEVKVAVHENTLRRNERLLRLQEQVAVSISALVLITSDMAKGGGEVNKRYIEILDDVVRMLCDLFYNESVSRRELLLININKDLKETLKNTQVSEWLFGGELENTIKAAKDLEKSGEQLKVKKPSVRQPSDLAAPSTSQQGNYGRPFVMGVQQMGHRVQRRTPMQNSNQKRLRNPVQRQYQHRRQSSRTEKKRQF